MSRQLLGQVELPDDLESLSGNTADYSLARSSLEGRDIAHSISDVIGDWAPIVDRYLDAFSFAPGEHISLLARRGARIVFAPTIADALTSDAATRRRGRLVDLYETWRIRTDYGPDVGVAGVFDPEIDALIFPTSYACRDLRRLTLHELGHALTVKRASIRPALLEDLPVRLHRHVFGDGYAITGDALGTLRQRVLEALAEGYVYLVEGRSSVLPPALASELLFMLQTMEDDDRLRFEFERTEGGERTASRGRHREIIDASDPDLGHLFAPLVVRQGNEPWSLAANELAARRSRRERAS